MLWESAHTALANVPDSLRASPQPWFAIVMVSILKMRTWSLGSFKLLVWGHPASRGATIDICSVWSVGCRFPQLSPAFPPSRTESRLKRTIDLGSILRDLGDLHAVWSLLFLLPNLRWFLWFLSFLTHFFAPFGLLAPLCKCSSAQLICSCLQFTCMSLSGTSTFASDFYFSLSDCSKSLNSTTSTQTQPWIRTVLSEEEAYG